MKATVPAPACPLPVRDYPRVLLAHGGGGRMMQRLIQEVFAPAFANPWLATLHDSAQLPAPAGRLAMTTDSYVVQPLMFPGGDIGSLAVHGTVNDLAMSGARPLYLSCGFILEEGLPLATLRQVAASLRAAADACGVAVVTGDTKVVESGAGNGLFINTTGLGVMEHSLELGPQRPQPGEQVILSGDLGRHGMAIMAVREGLQFETTIESDSAPVHAPVLELIRAGLRPSCLRDLTRGGLASALNEIAEASGRTLAVDERCIPVREEVHAACELLGLDPLQVANEGRFIAFLPAAEAGAALAILRRHPVSAGAVIIGEVTAEPGPLVRLQNVLGARRILDMPAGEQLPRIC